MFGIMKKINFIFLVHERPQLKHYPFLNIGNDHYYYDDYAAENTLSNNCENCYLPANRLMLDMIKNTDGKFKVSFAISGLALEQFEQFAPEVIDSFVALAKTGKVEFLAMPYSYSLASVFDAEEFKKQVGRQIDKMEQLFGYKPEVFFNSAMIYSDEIGEKIYEMGLSAVITEGAKQIMGWKSPHFIYYHPYVKKLKLLIRDSKLSDDINYRFSQWNWNEYPLTADKFMNWIRKMPEKDAVFNIMCGYEVLGIINNKQSGIFDFFKALPYFAIENGIGFSTPTESVNKNSSVGDLPIQYPISWTGEDKNLTVYCGNELQNEALSKLYNLTHRVHLSKDRMLTADWLRLQDISHFYFMDTRLYLNNGDLRGVSYESEYSAFMNYMNVLGDFIERVKAHFPSSVEDEELNSLLQTIRNQNEEIMRLKEEVQKLKSERRKKK